MRRASEEGLYFVPKINKGFRQTPSERFLCDFDEKYGRIENSKFAEFFRSSENGGGCRQGDYHVKERTAVDGDVAFQRFQSELPAELLKS